MQTLKRKIIPAGLMALVGLLPALVLADEAPTLDSGDTAWMLTSTVLVLFMTIPGLALFYAGMVRSKNVLSVMMQCFAITGLVTVLWIVAGTLSITADPTPSSKMTKSDTWVLDISVPIIGIPCFNPSAKLNSNPRDSKAATAIKIPKKKRILGNSILVKALCTGL